MTIDSITVVVCECIAAITWALSFKRLKTPGLRLFAGYLCVICIIELQNLVVGNSLSNDLVLYFNIPLQFIFLIWFLLCGSSKKISRPALAFIGLYLICFAAERLNIGINPVNFDSFSYGIGNLLLMTAIVMALVKIFKNRGLYENDQTMLFIVVTGMMVFYIGSFPYENFRNYFWSQPAYYNLAYTLHYLSQGFNCIMYLLFAIALKWKTK